MRYLSYRLTSWAALTAILGLFACDMIADALSTRNVDFPLGEAGVVETFPDTATVQSGLVRIDSIPLPERLWIAQEVNLDEDVVDFTFEEEGTSGDMAKSGGIECTVLIDKYPVVAWTITVEDGNVREVSPSSTPVPGLTQKRNGQKKANPAEIPFDQLEKMVRAFDELPESRRPSLPEELTFSLSNLEDFPSAKDRKRIFRGIHSGFADRQFELTLIARTQDNLRGHLRIEKLGFMLFDSGQRLLGGTETGS